jgi:hypothetical protein
MIKSMLSFEKDDAGDILCSGLWRLFSLNFINKTIEM